MTAVYQFIGGVIGFLGLLFGFLAVIIFGEQVIYWFVTAHWIPFPTSYLFLDVWSHINATLPEGFNIRSGVSLDAVFEGIPRDKNGHSFIQWWLYPLYNFCLSKEAIGLELIGEWLVQKPDLYMEGIGDVIWTLKEYAISIFEFLPLSLTFAGLSFFLIIAGVLFTVIGGQEEPKTKG